MDTTKAVVIGASEHECQMWYQTPESVLDATVIDPERLPAEDNVTISVSKGCVPHEVLPELRTLAIELMREKALHQLPRRVEDGSD